MRRFKISEKIEDHQRILNYVSNIDFIKESTLTDMTNPCKLFYLVKFNESKIEYLSI